MSLSEYVNVILPVPVAGTFTYRVPPEMQAEVAVGSRVIVPFGRRKFYTGIVSAFVPSAPVEFTLKDITHVLDSAPVVRHPQMQLWQWVADYYMCTVGDVYRAAVPTGLKIESETRIEINPDFDTTLTESLTEREAAIYSLLSSKGSLSIKDIEHQTGLKNVTVAAQKMAAKGVTVVSESLVNRYRAKRESMVRLTIDRDDPQALQQAFARVKASEKQTRLLMALVQMSNFTNKGREMAEVKVNELLERTALTSNILKALIDKGIAERYTVEVSRFRYDGRSVRSLPVLSEAQQSALDQVHRAFADHGVTLLHGITSSGKTEVYAHLIDYMLKQGRQVLYLVPEIALTTQLTMRLQEFFGDRLIIYHSKFTDNERVELWSRLLSSAEPCVVLGARSAVFLPFAKLGLVVVDEEHDASYKQYDPAPRYNARDTAIMLASMHGAKTLLGSATPAIETYHKALTGKYGLVSLTQRYLDAKLPQIVVTDMAKARKAKAVNGSLALSTIADIREAVGRGAQALIFHNRRGFAPMAHCTMCQYTPKCKYCDVSLTYHKRADTLTCHYCGTHYPLPQVCPVCKEPTIEVVGYGTERIEDEVQDIFSEARVLRMDLDTTRNKNSYENLISAFSSHKADILVGTQMVTKGLDFGDVGVVAVSNADRLIHMPDFRASEHAFNMLEQVSGRAGRRHSDGKVIIQTSSPDHPVIGFVQRHDYQGFYEHEISQRQMFGYPPFTRLIYIYLKHKDERTLDHLSSDYAEGLRALFGTRVNGPVSPSVAKVQSMYIRIIMLKFELNASMSRVRQILRDHYLHMHARHPEMRQLQLYYDVDPY